MNCVGDDNRALGAEQAVSSGRVCLGRWLSVADRRSGCDNHEEGEYGGLEHCWLVGPLVLIDGNCTVSLSNIRQADGVEPGRSSN